MSVATIFKQLHDRASWPPKPERPLIPFTGDLVPATEADLIPFDPKDFVTVDPASLARWTKILDDDDHDDDED
jgi:hypothetical protein